MQVRNNNVQRDILDNRLVDWYSISDKDDRNVHRWLHRYIFVILELETNVFHLLFHTRKERFSSEEKHSYQIDVHY